MRIWTLVLGVTVACSGGKDVDISLTPTGVPTTTVTGTAAGTGTATGTGTGTGTGTTAPTFAELCARPDTLLCDGFEGGWDASWIEDGGDVRIVAGAAVPGEGSEVLELATYSGQGSSKLIAVFPDEPEVYVRFDVQYDAAYDNSGGSHGPILGGSTSPPWGLMGTAGITPQGDDHFVLNFEPIGEVGSGGELGFYAYFSNMTTPVGNPVQLVGALPTDDCGGLLALRRVRPGPEHSWQHRRDGALLGRRGPARRFRRIRLADRRHAPAEHVPARQLQPLQQRRPRCGQPEPRAVRQPGHLAHASGVPVGGWAWRTTSRDCGSRTSTPG